MSGGQFNYIEYRLRDIADEIQQHCIVGTLDNSYAPQTLDEFKKAIDLVQMASIYLHHIDYLLSGDNGEDSFHEQLQTELEAYKNTDPSSDPSVLFANKGISIDDLFTPGLYIVYGLNALKYELVELNQESIHNMKIFRHSYEGVSFYGPVNNEAVR